MKAIESRDAFGFEHLALVDRPERSPGPGQVLVKVKAASLNYRDLLTIQGFYNPKQPLPLVPCSDGAGEVVEIGDGVTRVKTGDRVAGCFAQGWIAGPPTRTKLQNTTLGGPLDGMLTEYIVLHEDGVVLVPDHLNDEEAATLPCAALTAWSALARHGHTRPGDTVLVLGTGGVSIFALQFARMMGANVIATSSSDEKLERVKELGAAHGINYAKNPQWSKQVRELTGGEGVDHVIEVGGSGTLTQSMRSVKMGGTISLIGVLSGPEAPLNLTPVLMQDVRMQGVIVGHREAFEAMNRAITLHQLKPVIDKAYPMRDIYNAVEYMAAGKHFGKVCVRIA